MSSIMSMLRPPGGALPPPPGLAPGPLAGMPHGLGPLGPGGPGGIEPDLPPPPEVMALMKILGVSPGSPGSELEPEDQNLTPVEHIQAAMMHLMMAYTKEGDHSKGMGIVK